ncbi:hypothetical protein [Acidovorax sp. HMWF029]|uniref:hypothetical protein n=1 Tax=Acidovorax sp. HMWF029 TaxID=2056863 RepID=UPI001E349AFB|nr:hypothetical protein [Acidovorax sp. HMWF029]
MKQHRFGPHQHQPQPQSPAFLPGAGQGAPARWWAHLALAWLVLALVAAPTLGRLHQVLHGGAPDLQHAHAHVQTGLTQAIPQAFAEAGAPTVVKAPASAGVHTHHGLLAQLVQLVAGHASADCLLLDQLALGDALLSAPLALPEATPAQAQPHPLAGRSTLQHTALFLARGPPPAA